jgi:GTP 3',8-cyclase
LNCVVIAGQNEASLIALAERFRGTPHIVRFIEFMDVGTQNHWRDGQVMSAAEIVARIGARWPLEPLPAQHRGEVAQRLRYRDGGGEIGVIASVTQPFCGDCQRGRLSADGRLLTCLFAADGCDLKGPLRAGDNDAELGARLRAAWSARADRYSELRAERQPPPAARAMDAEQARPLRRRLEMYQVGG